MLLVNGLHDDGTPPASGRAVAGQLPGSVWIGADAEHAGDLQIGRAHV